MRKSLNKYINDIQKLTLDKTINIMEVCGTHTMAISRNGLRQLLPKNINLISGPGCPVCVTSIYDIDWILEIVKNYDLKVFTFGDMLRVPGSHDSLLDLKSTGKNITVCYSPMDALNFAMENRNVNTLFIAIGFETTAPLTSVVLKRAASENLGNFFVFSTHKIVPPALKILLEDENVKIDGFLCPGHVSAIIGSKPYEFIPKNYNVPCIISGFEPIDIIISIHSMLSQIKNGQSSVNIQYRRVVKEEGNPEALKQINNVFCKADSNWRGLGIIPGSGLDLKEEFKEFDPKHRFPVKEIIPKQHSGCSCGEILKGIKKPSECKLFAKACTPENPIGPCMVSSEGSCAAYYKYERGRN